MARGAPVASMPVGNKPRARHHTTTDMASTNMWHNMLCIVGTRWVPSRRDALGDKPIDAAVHNACAHACAHTYIQTHKQTKGAECLVDSVMSNTIDLRHVPRYANKHHNVSDIKGDNYDVE